MAEHMQLRLLRYALIWNLDRLADRIDRLNKVDFTDEVKDLLLELYREKDKYFKYLVASQ